MADRLNVTEDQRAEFKLTFQEKVIETLVAFANTSGGVLYVGVDDDGEVAGIEPGKETIQK
jgi:ATP-dependent DNA helicase RecG